MMEVFTVPFIDIMLYFYFIFASTHIPCSVFFTISVEARPTKGINIHYVDATANSS